MLILKVTLDNFLLILRMMICLTIEFIGRLPMPLVSLISLKAQLVQVANLFACFGFFTGYLIQDHLYSNRCFQEVSFVVQSTGVDPTLQFFLPILSTSKPS